MSDTNEWVLALDVSSKCIGYAYGTEGAVTKYGKYVSKTKSNAGKGLYNCSKWLSRLIHSLPKSPTRVVIEQVYYRRNAKTHAILNKYVAVVEREIYRICGIECGFISPSKVKSTMKVPKGKNYYDRKLNMVKKINAKLGLDLSFHKSNKNKSDDDIADAIALLLTYFATEDNEKS